MYHIMRQPTPDENSKYQVIATENIGDQKKIE
jgi:hypothetical protein